MIIISNITEALPWEQSYNCSNCDSRIILQEADLDTPHLRLSNRGCASDLQSLDWNCPVCGYNKNYIYIPKYRLVAKQLKQQIKGNKDFR